MTLDLYTVTDEPRKLDKTLPAASHIQRDGTPRGAVDILRPEILVSGDLLESNYCKISEFENRYYFVEERTAVREGLTLLTLRVDVLMSWRDEIKACPAVCGRSANVVNAFLPDSRIPVHAFRASSVKAFTALKFTSPSIIMITVG